MSLNIEDVDLPLGSRTRAPSWVKPLCRPCFRLDERVHADGFCLDCDEYMCKTCWTNHRKLKSLNKHVLRDLVIPSHVSSGKCQTVSPSSMCGRHGWAALEIYCTSCGVPCCRTCVGEDHASCDPVHLPLVPSPCAANSITHLTQLNKHLQLASKQTTLVIDKLKDHMAQSERTANEILDLRNVYDDFQLYVQTVVGDLSTTVDQLQQKHKHHHHAVMSKVTECLACLEGLQRVDGEPGRDQLDQARTLMADFRRLVASQPDRAAPGRVAAALGEIEDLLAATRLEEGDPGPPLPGWLEQGAWRSRTDSRPCHVSGALVSARRCLLADSGNGKVKVVDVPHQELLAEMTVPHLFR